MSTQEPQKNVGPVIKCSMVLAGIAIPIALIVGIIRVWPPPGEQDKFERVLQALAKIQEERNTDAEDDESSAGNGSPAPAAAGAQPAGAEPAGDAGGDDAGGDDAGGGDAGGDDAGGGGNDGNGNDKEGQGSTDGNELHLENRLILLVIFVGALGSYIGLATSFVGYAGNRRLFRSWLPWYAIRPFTGSALALLFYFTIRGGFVSTGSGAENINLFGVLAIAGLTGLFSKHASKKLEEVFKDLFKVDPDKPLQDPMDGGSPPTPVINKITPQSSPAGEAVNVKITGTNFSDSAKVLFGDKEIQPKKTSATELEFDLEATDVPAVGEVVEVKVVKPEDQGGASEAKKFTFT